MSGSTLLPQNTWLRVVILKFIVWYIIRKPIPQLLRSIDYLFQEGKLYGLDFARFSIPEVTTSVHEYVTYCSPFCLHHVLNEYSSDQWYKHLRPELTKMSPHKLNPDCYCKMDADDPDEIEKDKEAIREVRRLCV